MLTPEQQCVFDWLNDKLRRPVFAEAYKGALHMLHERSPGYITFVSHSGRDFINLLARSVRGIEGGRVDYQQHLDGLQNEWKAEWGTERLDNLDGTENVHSIPHSTCRKIKHLIDDHKAGRSRSSDADGLFFSIFLDYGAREKIPPNFLREWKAAKRWFVGHAHLRKDDFTDSIISELEKHFRMLDNLLYVAASSEYERMQGINEILAETNG